MAAVHQAQAQAAAAAVAQQQATYGGAAYTASPYAGGPPVYAGGAPPVYAGGAPPPAYNAAYAPSSQQQQSNSNQVPQDEGEYTYNPATGEYTYTGPRVATGVPAPAGYPTRGDVEMSQK